MICYLSLKAGNMIPFDRKETCLTDEERGKYYSIYGVTGDDVICDDESLVLDAQDRMLEGIIDWLNQIRNLYVYEQKSFDSQLDIEYAMYNHRIKLLNEIISKLEVAGE